MAGQGESWRCRAWRGLAGEVSRGDVGSVMVRQFKARCGGAWQGKAGTAGQGSFWHSSAWQGVARHGLAGKAGEANLKGGDIVTHGMQERIRLFSDADFRIRLLEESPEKMRECPTIAEILEDADEEV